MSEAVRLPSTLVDDDALLELLNEAADEIARVLGPLEDWGPSGLRAGQFRSDLVADAAALDVFGRADVAVLSEESGMTRPGRPITIVVDPLDGSTNASRGVPWYATSLCAVDGDGPVAGVVVNLVSGERYEAVRGGGAFRNGVPIRPTACRKMGDALVGLSGYPPRHLGWGQYRALGAVALDLCAVAAGVLDGFVDCSVDAHGPWDYMAGLLICTEAGGAVVDASGRDLVVLEHDVRLTPIAAGTAELLDELVAARVGFTSR